MDEKLVEPAGARPVDRAPEMPRRGFLGFLTVAVGGLIGLVLAVPGTAYVLSPLRKRGREGGFQHAHPPEPVGGRRPASFAIIEERQDAWVKYPREPVGLGLADPPEGRGSSLRSSR